MERNIVTKVDQYKCTDDSTHDTPKIAQEHQDELDFNKHYLANDLSSWNGTVEVWEVREWLLKNKDWVMLLYNKQSK